MPAVILKLALIAAVSMSAFGCGGSGSGVANSNGGDDPAARGRQIVDEYLKRDAAPYRKSRIRFTVTEEGEAAKVYEIESSRKQTADETTTLTQIVSPPDETGSSLAVEAKGKKTVIVTYAESLGDFRETDSKKIFFGGISAGELLGDWAKFNYRFLADKNLDGVKAFDVEGKLKADADSVVSRMVVTFRADDFVPVDLHMFGADGKEIRTYHAAVIKSDPTHPYASKIDVDNPVYKAHTVIEILSQEYPSSMDDSMFSRDKLKQPVRK